MSDSSRVGLYITPEIVWGDGGGVSPDLTAMRFTGESLKHDSEFASSEEIRPDRQVADVLRTSIGASGSINVEVSYGTYDALFEALLAGTWTTNVLDNGTSLRSFLIEKQFQDISEYVAFYGMRVTSASMNIEPGSIITGAFSFAGQKAIASGTTVGDGTPTAASATSVLNAIDNVSAVTEGGGAFAGDILSISLDVNNNSRPKPAVGVLGPMDIGFGQFQVTGSIQAYFDSRALYEKYLSDTASSFSFTLTDVQGNSYVINLPKLKWSDGNVVTPGNNQDVIADMTFTAYRDSSLGVTMRMTRTPA